MFMPSLTEVENSYTQLMSMGQVMMDRLELLSLKVMPITFDR